MCEVSLLYKLYINSVNVDVLLLVQAEKKQKKHFG